MSSAKRDYRVGAATEDELVDSGDGSTPEATRLASGTDAPPESEPRAAPPVAGNAPLPEGPQEPADAEAEQEGNAEPAHAEPAAHAHAEPAADDHGRKVELDLDELEARAEKADEYLELAQRTKADFENYRKRAAREATAAQERGVTRLARELLPAIDNLERALAATEADASGDGEDEGTLAAGIRLVQKDLIAALARVGIESFSPVGELFDPQLHEAIAQQPNGETTPGTIVEVYQRGYTLGESVLRPARVVVAG